jgi:phosphatidylserine/phosphatidylglycerophosphate/cardiolipin synthase-like enzyme
MKRNTLFFVFLILSWASSSLAEDDGKITLYFSPNGGCQKAIIQEIDNSEQQILIAAYSFSSKPIANALYRSAKRGVSIYCVVDTRQPTAHYTMVPDLIDNGIQLRVDRIHPLMHQKTIIIDNETLIIGSFNYSSSAENRNAELLAVIKSPAAAKNASDNWRQLWSISKQFDATASTACKNGKCLVKPLSTTPTPFFRSKRQWHYSQAP